MFSLDTCIEIFVNLFQSFMYISLSALFFEHRYSKKTNIIGFVVFVIIKFLALTFFTFTSYQQVGIYFLDYVSYILILEVYTLFFCVGNIGMRILLPFIGQMIVTIIGYVCSFTFSVLTNTPFETLATQGSVIRYLCMFVINITIFFSFFLIIKFSSKKIRVNKWTDISAFIIIPILVLIIIHSALAVLILTEYQTNVMIFLIVICASMIAVAVISWIMMSRISRDNEIRTRLLLTEQREQLYESNILQSNAQIEKISKIKHDMKNHLLCIGNLLDANNYADASELCTEVFGNLSRVYTPVNTANPLLNAVINVEQEKAANEAIDFVLEIFYSIKCFKRSSDIISIVGNMCDNAIEYLKTVPPNMRKMSLRITKENKCCVIICSNRVKEKEFFFDNTANNVEKSDKMGILKSLALKYGGTVTCEQKGDRFNITVTLDSEYC